MENQVKELQARIKLLENELRSIANDMSYLGIEDTFEFGNYDVFNEMHKEVVAQVAKEVI